MPAPFDTECELRRHGKAMHQLARALLHHGADADDVTQEAWLTALQSPPPLQTSHGGWLQTVVRRLAGRMRRSRSRRLAREVAVARPEAVPAADELAAKSELLHRVVDAVQGLDEPYRDAVWQRYFEELSPSAIAQQSGLPVATVKSRLQRGLALLRQRLDAGGEGGEWRQGLAAAFGLGGGVRVGAAAAAGVLLMGTAVKVGLGGGAIAIAATLFVVFADAPPRLPPPLEDPTIAPAAAPTLVEPPRTPVPRTLFEAGASPAAPPSATICGRCVDEAGAPLAQCTVALSGLGQGLSRTETWPAPPPCVTGADGRFEFSAVPRTGVVIRFEANSDGRARRTGWCGGLRSRQVVDVGDVVLPLGFVISGLVVDEHAAPIPSGQVILASLPPVWPIDHGSHGSEAVSGRVAADGSFTMSSPMPAGVWDLRAECHGYELVSPDHIAVDPAHVDAPLRVVMRALPRIEGIVVDAEGVPVAWVPVEAIDGQARTVSTSMSGRDGRFTLYPNAVDAPAVHIAPQQTGMPGSRLCELVRADNTPHAWGSDDIRVVVRRPLTVELTVIERGSGKPVTLYAVKSFPDRLGHSSHPLSSFDEHPDGRLELSNVWAGANSLTVVPADPALVPSQRIGFVASEDGTAPLRVELERMQTATVCVATAEGAPCAGVEVEIIALGTETLRLDQHVYDLRSDPLQFSTDLEHRFAEPRSTAITDADGRATVLVTDGQERLAVRVAAAGTPLALVQPAQIEPGKQFDVVVPLSANMVGRVLIDGFEPGAVRIACWRDRDTMPARHQGVQLQKDGSFVLRGLMPGTYHLQLRCQVVYSHDGAGDVETVPLGLAIPDVEVRCRDEERIEIDATAVSAAGLRGRALLDGVPAKDAHVFLRAADGVRHGKYRLADDGCFIAPALPPGTYRIGLLLADVSDETPILPAEAIALAPGQELARDFAFARTRLTVRLLASDGTPAANVVCQFEGEGYAMQRSSDDHGRVLLDPAPDGPVRLDVVLNSRHIEVGEVRRLPAQTEITLTLPSPK